MGVTVPQESTPTGSAPGAPPEAGADADVLPSGLRLAVMRLGRRLRQQAVGQVTASQLSALASVNGRGPLSLGELAGIEQIAPPSMTRIAARLEDMGLVERRIDAADRRVARLAITPAGEDLLSETRTRRDLYLARCLQRFTEEERRTLAAALPLLERLAVNDE
jgi:DNA-binding MarR family transcriptional regulator